MSKRLPLGAFNLGLALFFIFFYYFLQAIDSWGKWGLVAMEGVLVFAGLFLYSRKEGQGLYRGTRTRNILLALFVPLLIYPILLLGNGLFLSLLSNVRDLEDASSAITEESMGVWVYFFYAILPAICEETFFRGGLFQVFRRYGDGYSLWLTSFLFALFHFHIQNFIVPFLLGLTLGYIVLYTGRVLYAIIGHLVANTAGILFRLSLSPENIAKLRSLGLVKKIGSFESSLILFLLILSLVSLLLLRLGLGNQGSLSLKGLKKDKDLVLFGSLPLVLIVVFYCVQVF